MLFFLIQINADEAGNIENQPTPTTEIYAENTQTTDDRQETMQNSWIFASEIPSPFRIENKRTETAEQKVVVQTLASQEISRPALTDGEILDYLQDVFKDQTANALKVIQCESSADVYAISPTSDYGLFQINQIHFPEISAENKIEWLLNPINNIDFAKTLYDQEGWSPWYKSFNCHHLK